jgi:pyrrolidone-carboxylate peptidase
MYNVLHTGAKINSGIKTGFIKVGYQSNIAERVTVPGKITNPQDNNG